MTKTEIAALKALIARLESPRLGAAPGVLEFDEEEARLYLQTWIIGPLRKLLPGDGHDPKLALSMLRK